MPPSAVNAPAAQNGGALCFDRLLSGREAAAVVILGVLLAGLPLCFTEFPASIDFQAHIARIHLLQQILQDGADGDFYSRWYELGTFNIANIGTDVVALVIAQLVSAPQAGRLFLFLVMAVTFSGVFVLNYAVHRRLTLWPAMSCLLLHNWILSFGFIGYLLGVGLFLWFLGLWILIRDRPLWQRLLFGLIAGQILFYCHLAAFGCLAMSVAGLELYRAVKSWKRERWTALFRLVLLGLPLAVPLLVLVLGSPMGEAVTRHMVFAPWDRKLLFALRTITSRNLAVDLVTGGFLLLAGFVLIRQRAIRFAPEMLLSVALLTLAWLLLPARLFSSAYADARIPLAIFYLLVGITTVSIRSTTWNCVLMVGIGAVFLLRAAAISHDWAKYEQIVEGFQEGFDKMASSSLMIEAREMRDRSFYERFYDDSFRPLAQISNLAMLDRRIFVPGLYADVGKQPLNVRPRYAEIYRFQDYKPRSVETVEDLERVIARGRALVAEAAVTEPLYLILINPYTLRTYSAEGVEPIHSDPNFVLFRLH